MFQYTITGEILTGPAVFLAVEGVVMCKIPNLGIPKETHVYRSTFMLLDDDEDVFEGTFSECFNKLVNVLNDEYTCYKRRKDNEYFDPIAHMIIRSTTITKINIS